MRSQALAPDTLNLLSLSYSTNDPFDCLVDPDAVVLSSVSEPKTHSVVRDVIVACNQNERDLLLGRGTDLLWHPVGRHINLGTDPLIAQFVDNLLQVWDVGIGHWHGYCLYRCKPRRERTRVVLQ